MLEEVVVSRSRELVVANRRLRETIDCLGGLYRLMPGMVLVVDRRGAIRSISESGAWLLEYSVPELIGTPATLIFESLDVPAVFSALERLPARDAIIRTEALCTSRNGLKAPTEFAATRLRSSRELESGFSRVICFAWEIGHSRPPDRGIPAFPPSVNSRVSTPTRRLARVPG